MLSINLIDRNTSICSSNRNCGIRQSEGSTRILTIIIDHKVIDVTDKCCVCCWNFDTTNVYFINTNIIRTTRPQTQLLTIDICGIVICTQCGLSLRQCNMNPCASSKCCPNSSRNRYRNISGSFMDQFQFAIVCTTTITINIQSQRIGRVASIIRMSLEECGLRVIQCLSCTINTEPTLQGPLGRIQVETSNAVVVCCS